jgi:hypothetical protein
MHIVYETLGKLGIQDKVIITAFNKQDKPEAEKTIRDFKADYTVKITSSIIPIFCALCKHFPFFSIKNSTITQIKSHNCKLRIIRMLNSHSDFIRASDIISLRENFTSSGEYPHASLGAFKYYKSANILYL